ncbi:MAG: phospholipase D family protein [Desulfitobacteriaceae bacterium]
MLHIQDPTFDGNKLLHEALLDACSEASYGAGAYAFVTAGGVRMLMEDAIFADFIRQGRYHLVIGMDEVTNTQTLSALTSVRQHTNNLSINAFVHDTNGSTFHPKFSWFKTNDGGVIVVGSGNLTQKGLRRNREAFVFQHVSEEEIAQVEAMWNQWITSSAEYLKTITDNEVVEKAAENSRQAAARPRHRILRRPDRREEVEVMVPADEQDEVDAWAYDENSSVLIAEIPGRANGNNRWSQANFDAQTFREYFGAQPGVNGAYRLIMRNVLWDGTLGETKIRPSVSVASANYRFELTNAEGLPYPDNGRPLGVFVKVSERTFLYMLVFPTHEGHEQLQDILNVHRIRADRLVRYRTTARELSEICPALPLLYYLT